MKRAKAPSDTLFSAAQRRAPVSEQGVPLADRMRPRTLSEVAGQRHLIGAGKPLAQAIAADRVTSMILWGPPGCGKTTLAQVIAASTRARYVPYSAVLGSVPELRAILAEAGEARSFRGERTLLFLDEIHRFNKSQQDALLPDVERGGVVLVGATTENPSFAINAALLSRCRVFSLKAIEDADIVELLRRALTDRRGLASLAIQAEEDALEGLAKLASGDARRALGLLESAVIFATGANPAGS
ncbi:MAG: AAA family ATPase [Polyangiaceae bacterium]